MIRIFFLALLITSIFSCTGQNENEIIPDDFSILDRPFRLTGTYELKIDGSLIHRSTYFEISEFQRINLFKYDSTHTKWAYNPMYLTDTIENKNNLYLGWKSWPHKLTIDYILVDWGYENQSDTLFYTYKNEILIVEQKLFNSSNEPWTLRYAEYVLDENYIPELQDKTN